MDRVELWGGAVLRWLHLSAAAIVLGALLCAVTHHRALEGWQRLVAGAAMLVLVASGLAMLATKTGLNVSYHLWLAVKILLAAHVFAVLIRSLLIGSSRPPRTSPLVGALIAGWVVLLLAAYLHQMSVR